MRDGSKGARCKTKRAHPPPTRDGWTMLSTPSNPALSLALEARIEFKLARLVAARERRWRASVSACPPKLRLEK